MFELVTPQFELCRPIGQINTDFGTEYDLMGKV